MRTFSKHEQRHMFDAEAEREAISSTEAFSALGILSSPDYFFKVCKAYDKLLGYMTPTPPASDIINDRARSWYTFATAYILRQSRLEIDELVRVLDTIIDVRKRDKKFNQVRASDLIYIVLCFCQSVHFEPRWHQRRRGDDRPLPSDKNKDLWGYLCRLYTDPEYSRMRMPDNIKRIAPMYKGYEDCVRKAVSEGHRRLQEIYGPDVDLSPLTEKRKKDDDFDGASFMRLLAKGSPFAIARKDS